MIHKHYKGWPNKSGVNEINVWKKKKFDGVVTVSNDCLEAIAFMKTHRNPKTTRASRIKNREINYKMPRRQRLLNRLVNLI
jgi:hypothetical protein